MDEEILSTLAYFQEELEEMSIRFQKLKDITYNLYKENQSLKEENAELRRLAFQEDSEGNVVREGYSNLLHLYNEGYHVCHLSFGERRRRECLFCIQLLENQMEEEE